MHENPRKFKPWLSENLLMKPLLMMHKETWEMTQTCWCVECMVSRRPSKSWRGFALVTNPVVVVSNLSICPFTVPFFKVTCCWTVSLIWLIWTISTEITDFVDVDALSVTCTPTKHFLEHQQFTLCNNDIYILSRKWGAVWGSSLHGICRRW